MEAPDVSPAHSRLQDALSLWQQRNHDVHESFDHVEQAAIVVRACLHQCLLYDRRMPVLGGHTATLMAKLRQMHPEIAQSMDDVEPEDLETFPEAKHPSPDIWPNE